MLTSDLANMWMPKLHLDIRPEERRNVCGAFLTLGGFMAGHALLETARDALFLARLPARQLPWVYLGIALVALFLTQAQRRVAADYSARRELSLWLVSCSAVTLGFWFLVGWAGDWIYYALYLWSGTLATLVVVRFWTVLGALFSFTQAKRLFAVIGSGSVLGAIAGSALAVLLAEYLPPRYLISAAAALFLLSAAAPRILRGSGPVLDETEFEPVWELRRLSRMVWERPYLRRVATVIAVSTITFTLVDYVFKSAAGRLVPAAELDEFFSSVYLTLNILSLIVQLFLVSWLLRRFGVHAAQALPPLLLVFGAGGFLIGGGLVAALLLKGVDGAMRHSLNRTVTELLFVSLPEKTRGRVKGFIDVIGQRGGQALASILILVGLEVVTDDRVFSALTMAVAGLWLFLAYGLKRHYMDVFRETLDSEITQTKIDFPTLDLASFEMLLSTLNDPDDRKVLAALDLLAEQGKVGVVPALILYHPSRQVALRGLELLAASSRQDFLPVVERLQLQADPEVRVACLRVLSNRRPDQELFRQALQDPSPMVRATGLVGLISAGFLKGEEAAAARDQLALESSADDKLALARAIRWQPSAGFEDLLLTLAADPGLEVRREAIRAMAALPRPPFLGPLIQALAVRALRDEARAALEAFGEECLPVLEEALGNPRLSHSVRRHLPGTIAGFEPERAVTILQAHLLSESDGMVRFKILRAIGRLRNQRPDLVLNQAILSKAIQDTLAAAERLVAWRHALEQGAAGDPRRATSIHEVLVTLLKHKQRSAVERLFRLLNLLLGNEEFRRIHRGLTSSRMEARASSRELLENLLPSDYRQPVLELVDQLEDTGLPGREKPLDYDAALRLILKSGSETLSCLAAYHAGELGLKELRESLESELASRIGLARRVLQHAIGLLTGSEKATHYGR